MQMLFRSSKATLRRLTRIIFGDGFGGDGEVKRWCREANATAWESEKPVNR